MFMNRHLNFGYLLVLLVVFVVAISAGKIDAQPLYTLEEKREKALDAETAGERPDTPKEVIRITLNVRTGDVEKVEGGILVRNEFKREGDVRKGEENNFEKNNVEGLKIKKIIPGVIFTHEGSHCIEFWIGGFRYRYCPPH